MMDGLQEFLSTTWLIWLIVLFIAVLWWSYRPKNKAKWEDAAQIPLRDEEPKGDDRERN